MHFVARSPLHDICDHRFERLFYFELLMLERDCLKRCLKRKEKVRLFAEKMRKMAKEKEEKSDS